MKKKTKKKREETKRMMRDFEDIFLKRAHVRVTQKTKKKKKKKRKSFVSFGLLFGGRASSFFVYALVLF